MPIHLNLTPINPHPDHIITNMCYLVQHWRSPILPEGRQLVQRSPDPDPLGTDSA